MKNSIHIKAFEKLSRKMKQTLDASDINMPLNRAIQKSYEHNPWFTPEFTKTALGNILPWLTHKKLSNWINKYNAPDENRKVGIIMAGNIPLVGFHDFLCTLMSGHTAIIKLSGKDKYLFPVLANELIQIEPHYQQKIKFVEEIPKDIDALIATGSDNTARYFDYYYKKIPRIIRKNRTSVAVLSGKESITELTSLADDICTFFGLGCRNISKIYIPNNTILERLIKALRKFNWMLNHEQYASNIRYQKARLNALDIPCIDAGPVLLSNEKHLNSQVGIVHFEYYDSMKNMEKILQLNAEKIQCIVGNESINSVNLGSAQEPDIDDYADNVDTMKFLTELP